MVTCKSPVAVMRAAHALGAQLFDEHSHPFSRKDFSLPQLFACLVLREHQKKSYRGTEELLRDCSDLRDAVGLIRAPDHNTICRAFTHLIKPAKMNRALDLQVAAAKAKGLNVKGDSVKRAALDSTCFESRNVSRHFEKRQRQTAKQRLEVGMVGPHAGRGPGGEDQVARRGDRDRQLGQPAHRARPPAVTGQLRLGLLRFRPLRPGPFR